MLKSKRSKVVALAIATFACSIVLAVQANDPLTSILLVVLGAVLQVGSLVVASSEGKADPTLARSHVRHLSAARERASSARAVAELARETPEQSTLAWRETVGILSVHLSFIEEDILLAIDDWYDFSSDALSGGFESIREGRNEQN